MRKVYAGIAAAVVIAAGGAAVTLAPSGSHKPSLNDIGSGGGVQVLASFGKLTNEADPAVDGSGIPSSFTNVSSGGVWHTVRDFNADQVQTLAIGSTTAGAGAGKVTFNPLTLTIPVDQSYPVLFQNMSAGIPSSPSFVRLDFVKPNQTRPYMQITLKLAAVKELTLVPDADAGSLLKVQLAYGAYQLALLQTASGTTPSAPIIGGWNVVRNVVDVGQQPIS